MTKRALIDSSRLYGAALFKSRYAFEGVKNIRQTLLVTLKYYSFTNQAKGKNISLLEMSKFVPQILREFEINWAGSEEWSVNSSWFAKQTGVFVSLEDRNRR